MKKLMDDEAAAIVGLVRNYIEVEDLHFIESTANTLLAALVSLGCNCRLEESEYAPQKFTVVFEEI